MTEKTQGDQQPVATWRRGSFIALTGLLCVLSVFASVRILQQFFGQARFCEPRDRLPGTVPLLGPVPGQSFKGNVWIHFTASDVVPAGFSYTGNRADAASAVLDSALGALQDNSRPMQRLPYTSVGVFTESDNQGCLRPDPAVRGYIVIEVWDNQINLGYGGDGLQLRAQAGRVVAKESERLR